MLRFCLQVQEPAEPEAPRLPTSAATSSYAALFEEFEGVKELIEPVPESPRQASSLLQVRRETAQLDQPLSGRATALSHQPQPRRTIALFDLPWQAEAGVDWPQPRGPTALLDQLQPAEALHCSGLPGLGRQAILSGS